MKKFRFNLDHVLKFRKMKEEEALRNLSETQKKYQMENERKNNLILSLDVSIKRKNKLNEQVVIASFQVEEDFILGTKQRIIQADHAIFRARRQVEKALRNYLFFRRQTRMIEILHEKAYQEFRKIIAKKEQKETEDLVIMRFRMGEEIL